MSNWQDRKKIEAHQVIPLVGIHKSIRPHKIYASITLQDESGNRLTHAYLKNGYQAGVCLYGSTVICSGSCL